MDSLSRFVDCFESLFGIWADEAASATKVILRQRNFTARTLAATFVLGFLRHPNASSKELAAVSGRVGEPVSPQAIEQRQHQRMVDFLRRLFESAVKRQAPSGRRSATAMMATVMDRFAQVQILDSTTIALPAEMAQEFSGCGGSHGGTAALKLQVRMDLKNGTIDAVRIEQGRDCDASTPLQNEVPVKDSLRIADLGYFDTEVFQHIDQAQAFWLSPFKFGTTLQDENGKKIGTKMELLAWLERNGPIVDRTVRLADRQLPCRLIAWRLPQEFADRRRQKLYAAARRKGGKESVPSAERLAQCDWAILITNVPEDKLSIDEARVLYRARWQIELLFKRWKSQGFVDAMTDTSPIRCMVKLWSRLLAAFVQQWIQSHLWGRLELSLVKVWDLVREEAARIASSWRDGNALRDCIATIEVLAQKTARRDKRKQPSTFEMLCDPSRLPYALT